MGNFDVKVFADSDLCIGFEILALAGACSVGSGGNGLFKTVLSERGIFEGDCVITLLGLTGANCAICVTTDLKGVPVDGRDGCRDLILCDRGSIDGLSMGDAGVFMPLERASEDFVGDRRL